MSVINRVLKDLDRQRVAPGAPAGVRAIAPAPRRSPLWLGLGLAGVVALGAGASLLYLKPWTATGPAEPAPSAPPPVAPVAPAPEPPRTEAPAEPAAPGVRPAPMQPNSVPVAPPATLGLRPETELSRSPAEQETKAGEPAQSAAREDKPPLREDKPRVVKEIRTPTPREQAGLSYAEARRYIEQGRLRDALLKLATALELQPDHLAARQTLAALLMEGGDAPRAEAVLKEGAALHPTDSWFPKALGQLHIRQGNLAAAASALQAGAGKAGNDAEYWGLLGSVLARQGRLDEAVPAYRQALRLNPGNGTDWVGLAVALERQGRLAEAAAAYREAARTRLPPELKNFVGQKTTELGG